MISLSPFLFCGWGFGFFLSLCMRVHVWFSFLFFSFGGFLGLLGGGHLAEMHERIFGSIVALLKLDHLARGFPQIIDLIKLSLFVYEIWWKNQGFLCGSGLSFDSNS